jgi:hypothetical protein
MMINEIIQKLGRLAAEGRISSEELRRFERQEIEIAGSYKLLKGC